MNDEITITRSEYEEYKLRVEDMNSRQNQRLEILEAEIAETRRIAANVERLATNMESMLKEQEKQGKRLETLENRESEKHRSYWGYIVSAIITLVIGFLFGEAGFI